MSTRSPPRKRLVKPTPAQLAAARGKKVQDLIRPGLRVLFVGINPSLYSAAVKHHFARPGNRFYKALFFAGFTERVLRPDEGLELLQQGIGITNVVARATASAAELADAEYVRGFQLLRAKVHRYRPEAVAFLGVTAYRCATRAPRAQLGLQAECLATSRVFVMPNPSGLNAHYQLDDLSRAYRELAVSAGFVKATSD